MKLLEYKNLSGPTDYFENRTWSLQLAGYSLGAKESKRAGFGAKNSAASLVHVEKASNRVEPPLTMF